MGVLLPALSGVRKRSAKATEVNSLKQIYYAWSMYANHSNDSAVPGYLDVDVQEAWQVEYQYPTTPQAATPGDTTIPPAPDYTSTDNVAGPWTWRLLQYVDHSHEVIHGYADETDESIFELVNEGAEVAEEPAFGYNGLYLGGWWRMQSPGTGQPAKPLVHFFDHCCVEDDTRLTIPTTLAQIHRSTEMVAFCSSSKFQDSATTLHVKIPSDIPGAHLVTPPTVGVSLQWKSDPSDPTAVHIEPPTLQFFEAVFSPIGRYTGYAAVAWADGHCDSQGINALNSQSHWINNAEGRTYTHQVCPPAPPP
jgi:hypothetical protein